MKVLLVSTIVLSALIPANITVAQSCTNQWTNPRTGKVECLNVQGQPQTSTTAPRSRSVSSGESQIDRNYIPGSIFLGKTRNGDRYYLRYVSVGATYYDRNLNAFTRQPSFYLDTYKIDRSKESSRYYARCGYFELKVLIGNDYQTIAVPDDEGSIGALAYNYVCTHR